MKIDWISVPAALLVLWLLGKMFRRVRREQSNNKSETSSTLAIIDVISDTFKVLVEEIAKAKGGNLLAILNLGVLVAAFIAVIVLLVLAIYELPSANNGSVIVYGIVVAGIVALCSLGVFALCIIMFTLTVSSRLVSDHEIKQRSRNENVT